MPKQFKSWRDFYAFSRSVRHSSRFVHDRKVMSFLNTLLETSEDRHRLVSAGKYVWRAQLGCSSREREQDGATWDEPAPYPAVRMKPLSYAAHEGRVNPKGIPCLYVASNKETAMSEVRPWVGGSISVGQFRTMRELRLIDFSVGHDSKFNFFFEEPSPEKREKAIWTEIDRAFSAPVVSDPSTAEYVPTQVISEFFRMRGFDGVVYKSQLASGFNLALFDLNAANLTYCALHTVKSVSFMFGDAEDAYHVKSDSGASQS